MGILEIKGKTQTHGRKLVFPSRGAASDMRRLRAFFKVHFFAGLMSHRTPRRYRESVLPCESSKLLEGVFFH